MSGTRQSSRSTVIVNQSQASSETSAFCGMFSINNAVQERDLLTKDIMAPILDQLKITHPTEDHGSKTSGKYSMLCLSHALHTKGWHMVYLNNKLPYADIAKKKWYARLATTVKIRDEMEEWEKGEEIEDPATTTVVKRLVIIGIPPNQKGDVLHAIAMAKGKLIDPDLGTVVTATADQLRQWMEHVSGVYAVMTNGEVAQFMEDQQRLEAKQRAKMAAKGKIYKRKRKC